MKIIIPKPPSVNHIYGFTARGGFARSYITKDGIQWFEKAAGIIGKTFKRKSIPDPVEVYVDLYYHPRKQDVDNILKPTLDVLSKWCVKCQTKVDRRKGCRCGKNLVVLIDDDQVYRLTCEKHKIIKGVEEERLIVEIMGYA